MNEPHPDLANNAVPLGTLAGDFLMTENGWVALGTKSHGMVLTPHGWIREEGGNRRLAIGIATGVATLLISLVGLIMANASVSLLTGTGTNWTGFVIAMVAVVAGVLALILTRAPLWTVLVTAIVGGLVVLLALASVVYYEVQLEQRRQDLFSSLGHESGARADSRAA